MHEDLIRENLGVKLDIRQHLELLKFISYMTPFLIGMRKRMKIPDVTRLLPPLTGKLLPPSSPSFLPSLLPQSLKAALAWTLIPTMLSC